MSADGRLAIVRFEQQARDSHARGVAQLLSGRLDEAVRLLDGAAAERPSAAVQADFAAAYLERAHRPGHFDDFVRALAAAHEALRLDRAFTGRTLQRGAGGARAVAPARSAAPSAIAWRASSTARGSRNWTRPSGNLCGPIASGNASASKTSSCPNGDRPVLRGDAARADRLIGEVGPLAQRPRGVRRDDAVGRGAADPGERRPARERQRTFARAFVGYGQARRALAEVDLGRAAALMAAAARDFRTVGSLYALWDPVFAAIRDRMAGRVPAALAALDAAFARDIPPSYLHLRGRVWWTRAVCHESSGQLEARAWNTSKRSTRSRAASSRGTSPRCTR